MANNNKGESWEKQKVIEFLPLTSQIEQEEGESVEDSIVSKSRIHNQVNNSISFERFSGVVVYNGYYYHQKVRTDCLN